jgi:hypothetical protein
MCKRTAHNKLTRETVIEQFKEVHGDGFDYSKVVYVDINTPVEIYCKKHELTFYPTPKNHRNGSKCYFCGREAQIEKAKKGFEEFKEEMFELYGEQYDFSNSIYINTKTPLTAVCSTHGEFSKPPYALLNGSACDECAKNTKSNNKDIFIEEAKKVYGDKDDYTDTEVISSKYKVKVRCTKHDVVFEKSIQNYLAGSGCPKCSAENYRRLRALSPEEYYKRANEKHENKYTYTGDYTTLNGVVTFFCEEHGEQRLNANSHLIGSGCKKCETSPIKTNKRTKEGYCKLANGRPTHLYLIECFKDGERFYKVGKTFNDMKVRYSKSKMYYDYEVKQIYTASAEEIWDLEESIHLKYKQYRYHPKNWFAGYSESYRLSLPIQEIWTTS